MSLDSALGGIQSLTNQIQTGINTVVRTGADIGAKGVFGNSSFWFERLASASYRGVPFGVLGGDSQFGRRNVTHEYPYRDTVWVEDLGRSARRIKMTGFLVGDDCIAQRDRMIEVCEQDGTGTLVHPTFGVLTVNLIGSLSVSERWDKGRMFEIGFSFIQSGDRIFPAVETSTGDAVNAMATATDAAASVDFAARAGAALKNGAAVVGQAVTTVAAWATTAQMLANDATNLHHMVVNLPGNLGRFAGGRNTAGLLGVLAVSQNANTVGGLIALGSLARSGVASAVTALSTAAAGLGS